MIAEMTFNKCRYEVTSDWGRGGVRAQYTPSAQKFSYTTLPVSNPNTLPIDLTYLRRAPGSHIGYI